MTKPADDADEKPPTDDRIAVLSDGLLNAYGADACEVIERQIEAADSDEARSTWIAIWERLCVPAARRA